MTTLALGIAKRFYRPIVIVVLLISLLGLGRAIWHRFHDSDDGKTKTQVAIQHWKADKDVREWFGKSEKFAGKAVRMFGHPPRLPPLL
jgi:hypothetical protein